MEGNYEKGGSMGNENDVQVDVENQERDEEGEVHDGCLELENCGVVITYSKERLLGEQEQLEDSISKKYVSNWFLPQKM